MTANPFDFQHPVTGPAFVNRTGELDELLHHCRNRVNVLLLAPRRLGKSSLIEETFHRLDRNRILCVYVDALLTADEGEVAQLLLNALGDAAFGPVEKGWLWLQKQFKTRRPAYTPDPQTMLPSLTLQRVDEGLPNLQDVLERVEETARKRGRRAVVAIDEFQTLVERAEADRTIATIRSVVQQQRHASYIFSGSKPHVLSALVRERNAPFWGQLRELEIGGIPFEHFRLRARQEFAQSRRTLTDDVLDRIGELCQDHPKRVQEMLFDLYETSDPLTPDRVDELLDRQIAAEANRLEDVVSEVREGAQKRLLLALARDGGPQEIYGKPFLKRHDLGTPANVQKAAKAMQERGILDRRNWFIDPHLVHFLRKRMVGGSAARIRPSAAPRRARRR